VHAPPPTAACFMHEIGSVAYKLDANIFARRKIEKTVRRYVGRQSGIARAAQYYLVRSADALRSAGHDRSQEDRQKLPRDRHAAPARRRRRSAADAHRH